MTDQSRLDTYHSLCGQATTLDRDEDADGESRGLQAARAIRRALADARRKAAELSVVWAFHGEGSSEERVHAVIGLALGPFAAGVEVNVTRASGTAEEALAAAAKRAREAVASGRHQVALAVSVGIGGRNIALAFCADR